MLLSLWIQNSAFLVSLLSSWLATSNAFSMGRSSCSCSVDGVAWAAAPPNELGCHDHRDHHHHRRRRRAGTERSAHASRREALGAAAAAAAVWLVQPPNARVAHAATTTTTADIDYSKVQDLLGTTTSESTTTYYSAKKYGGGGGARPTYLTEPTKEFKENEAKAAIFKRLQLEQKRTFVTALEKLETDPNNEDALAQDLDQLRRLVKTAGGLPLGVTKDELVKRVRRRKAKKYWPTNVEIAYQDLIQEINYQQSPNTERDMDNPL